MKSSVLTKETVASRLESLGSLLDDASIVENDQLWQYRMAAAVLSSFDPGKLKPLKKLGRGTGTAVSVLIGDTYIAYDAQGEFSWSLKNDVRLAALRRLGSRSAMQQALQMNQSRPDGILQQVFESYINGTSRPPTEMSRDELTAALVSCQWLRDVLPGLPEEAAIRRQLDLVTLLGTLRALAGTHFRGREMELERLRSFVFAPIGQKTSSLAVTGVGGAGKSTLIARFILKHATVSGEGEPLAFVYLDFDRSVLSADQPITILVEAVRQLEIQFPAFTQMLQDARDTWGSYNQLPQTETSGMGSSIETDQFVQSSYLPYVTAEFVSLIQRMSLPRLLFVLDTFEEVQYLGSQFVYNIVDLLGQLRGSNAPIVALFATRTPLILPDMETLSVNELDWEAALGYVAAHGVSDPSLARQVVERIGRNPLSLSLAATVIRTEGEQGAEAFTTFDVQQELIQGQLYRRILQHIHNPNVRKLSHPGLVVRKITPEVILEVLSGPCKVRVKDKRAAEELFRELKREDTLVRLAEDGGVTHREDVRQVMLSLLNRDMPATVRKIHKAAVAFYKKQADTASRAEEIYHRLCLDQNPSVVENRWVDGIESQLRSSLVELPLRAKRYLASKLGIEPDSQLVQTLTLIDWENSAERRALQFMRFNRFQEALAVLNERTERSQGSRIPLLEAQSLQYINKPSQARRVAMSGLKSAESYGEGNLIIDYLSFLGALEATARHWTLCKTFLDRALTVANSLGNKSRQVEIGLTRLVLLRSTRVFSAKDRLDSKEALADLVRGFSEKEFSRDTALAFDVGGEVGDEHPDIVKSVILTCGLPPVHEKQLLDCLSKWDRQILEGKLRWTLARAAGLPVGVSGTSTNPWQSLTGVKTGRLNVIVQSLLRRFSLTKEAAGTFARFMRNRAAVVQTETRASGSSRAKTKPAPAPVPTTQRKRAARRLRSSRFVARLK